MGATGRSRGPAAPGRAGVVGVYGCALSLRLLRRCLFRRSYDLFECCDCGHRSRIETVLAEVFPSRSRGVWIFAAFKNGKRILAKCGVHPRGPLPWTGIGHTWLVGHGPRKWPVDASAALPGV